MKSSLLWLLLALLVLEDGGADAGAILLLAAPTQQDLNQALLNGDSAKAKEVAATLKLSPGMVKLIDAQLDYDLPRLHALAEQCQDAAALHLGVEPALITPALSCNFVAYRSAMVMGDAREAFRALVWVKHVGFPAMVRLHRGTPRFGNAFDHADLDQIAKSLPPFSTQLSSGSASIDYSNALNETRQNDSNHVAALARATSIVPTVTIMVNGKQVKTLVDTGSTAGAVLMDQAHAKMLGVKTLVDGLAPIATMGRNPAKGRTSLGLIDTLVFGPLTVHNVLATVVPTGYLQVTGVVVGLPLIARLRQVSFGRSRMTIGNTDARCKAPLPLTFASSSSEDGKLVFAAKADSQTIKASIDTGSNVPLIAGRRLMPPGMDNDGGGQSAITTLATSVHRYLEVWVGKDHFAYDNVPVLATAEVPDVLIGAPILEGWNVRFNFLRPSLCLAPRSLQGG